MVMGATSSRRNSVVAPPTIPIPIPIHIPIPTPSSCTMPEHSSSISSTCTPYASPSPSIAIPRHIKEKRSSLLNRMKRIILRDPPKYQHTPAWHEYENTKTRGSVTGSDEYPESSQYRQFQSTPTPTFEISSPRLRCTEGIDPSPLSLTQSVTAVPVTSRTIHIQPNPRLINYFSRHANNQSSWLSLEWILATRSATHGLFDAYPYHVFDAFLLRTHPTFRPCLSFLHHEQIFRDKWTGWRPYHSSHTWKISSMVTEAKKLYHIYLIPIMAFLSAEVISRYEDIGLTSTSIDSTQDMDVTLFIHGDMFLPAVHEVMNALRTGPFQSFIHTRQYQELAGPTH